MKPKTPRQLSAGPSRPAPVVIIGAQPPAAAPPSARLVLPNDASRTRAARVARALAEPTPEEIAEAAIDSFRTDVLPGIIRVRDQQVAQSTVDSLAAAGMLRGGPTVTRVERDELGRISRTVTEPGEVSAPRTLMGRS